MQSATCRKCGAAFDQTPAAAARGVHQCNACRAAANQVWRLKQRAEGKREIKKPKTAEAKKKAYLRDAAAYRADPERRRRTLIRSAARYAASVGKLTKQPCEVCGGWPVEGHHDDYEKPLEVRWLCPEHHRQHHRNLLNKAA
ncbi:hypothetical protein [Brevundimonas sp. Marseille-Q4549]